MMPLAAAHPPSRALCPPPRRQYPLTAPVAYDTYPPPRRASTPGAPIDLVPLVQFDTVPLGGRHGSPPPWREVVPQPVWPRRLKVAACAMLVIMVPAAIVYLAMRAMRRAAD